MNVELPIWARQTEDEALARLVAAAVRAEKLTEDEVERVRAFCAGRELSPWLWDLIERWRFKGAGEQAMTALFGWTAREDDVSRLGEMLRQRTPWTDDVWARIAPRRRGLALLEAVGTPLALLELLRFSEHTRIDDLYRAATNVLWTAAHARGLEPGEVAEMCAPELGFVGGRRAFDYGARTVEIDARAWPDVRLPRTRSSDDAALAAAARQRWKWLVPQLGDVLSRAPSRLERAMVTRRRWDHAAWRAAWHDHGIASLVARNVVWRALTNDGPVSFVLTDHEALDVDLEPLDLDAGWAFEVPHPVDLDVARWTEIFIDLQLVQPFEQLGRAASARRPAANLDPDELVAASAWGWERRATRVGPSRDLLVCRSGEFEATVRLRPGIATSDAGRVLPNQPPQQAVEVAVRDVAESKRRRPEDGPPLLAFEIELLLARAAR